MEISSPFLHIHNPSSSPAADWSLSSYFSPFLLKTHIKSPKPTSRKLGIVAVAVDPQELPQSSPHILLKDLEERKRATSPRKKVPKKSFIVKPPVDDNRLAEKFLNSPQLSLKSFPLLSSCLPSSRLNNADQAWIDEYLLEAKQALGYPLEPSDKYGDDNPAKQFDTLLYLAFQHPACDRAKTKLVRSGHSRLAFLGQYVLELAFAEYFLQRYPRESPGPLRERVYGLIGKRNLPKWIKAASLENLVFPSDDFDRLIRKELEPPVKSVFWALFGAIYLCFGMPEVYRVLFEVFGMDPDSDDCQPKLRIQLQDLDYVSVEFQGDGLSWQDITTYKPPEDALFAHPRLHRACVPPGMHRFRGNLWDFESKPKVMQALGYPLAMKDRIPEITEARNIELGLGLQLCFLHKSKHKLEHPRFCYERLEYLGQKIQDVVLAEKLLMNHLGSPGHWIQERHRKLLMNKFCGRYLREKHLHHCIIYSDEVVDAHEQNRRLRNPSTTAVQQALHGLAYTVYGKAEVRRLMFEVFDFEQSQPKEVKSAMAASIAPTALFGASSTVRVQQTCPNFVRPPRTNPTAKASLRVSRFGAFGAVAVTPKRLFRVLASSGLEDGDSETPELELDDVNKGVTIDLKLPRRRLLVQFTCDSCGQRTERVINRLAYERGTVFVQCAGCLQHHQLVDNLGLVVEYDFREEISADMKIDQV